MGHEVDAAVPELRIPLHLRHRDDSIDADRRMKSNSLNAHNKPGPSGSSGSSQAVPLLAEITATIATASSPCPGKSLHQRRPSPHSRQLQWHAVLMSHRYPLWYFRMTQARTATIPKPNPGCSQTMPHCFQQLDGLWRRVESWTREFVDPCRHAMSTPHLCRNKAILTAASGDARQRQLRSLLWGALKITCCPSRRAISSLDSERTGDSDQWLATNKSHCGSPGLGHSGNTVDLPPAPGQSS